MAEKLEWLDQEYLSHYDRNDREAQIDSHIPMQKGFDAPKEVEAAYSITEEEDEENGCYLSISDVVGTDLDPKLYVAFQILEYALIDAPGAPLKQALLDAKIGGDIMGGYDSGILQPYFSVIAKDARADQKGEFLAVVKGTLRKLANEGLNRKSLLAAMNYYEFKYREADYGNYPKGLMYGLQCMDSWLYDGDPMMHLAYGDTFAFLKEAVKDGYFEQLIKDYLLDNPFEAIIVVKPEKNLTAKEDARVAEKLAAYKERLTAEEKEALIRQTKELKEYQDIPSSPEELALIPMLERKDIKKEAEKLKWEEHKIHGIQVLHHDIFTSGIGYLRVLFHTNRIPDEDLPYAALLRHVLSLVDTEHYSYSDLTSEINLNTGGLSLGITSYVNLKKLPDFTGAFSAEVRVLY